MKPIILPEQDYLNSLLYYNNEEALIYYKKVKAETIENIKLF